MSKLGDLLNQDGWTPIARWIKPMTPVGQSRAPYPIIRFCHHVRKTPTELLTWQEGCVDAPKLAQRRELFRIIQEYINDINGTKAYKSRDFGALLSFFRFHDQPLDVDPTWRIHGTKPKNVGGLMADELKAVLTAAHVRRDYAMHSMILCQFQSFSGVAEITYINQQASNQIVEQLKANKDPVRIDMLKSRKENDRPWFTYIGTDAIHGLREYFEKQRNWPNTGEVIWLDNDGGPMTAKSYAYKFLSLTRHVKIVPKQAKGRGIRYGKSPHKLRNLARSLVHAAHSEQHELEGKKLLFDAACPEFWMGHSYNIDPLKYNEFWNHDPDGVRQQYTIAEKYLNILSGAAADMKETAELRDKVAELEVAVKMLQGASGFVVKPMIGGEIRK